jgi:hypothetical protein
VEFTTGGTKTYAVPEPWSLWPPPPQPDNAASGAHKTTSDLPCTFDSSFFWRAAPYTPSSDLPYSEILRQTNDLAGSAQPHFQDPRGRADKTMDA